jgi:predicted permease
LAWHAAIYAIVHQVVLHPLQVPDAGRVAILYEQRPGGPNDSLMERAAHPLLSSPPAAFSAVGAELTRAAILQDFRPVLRWAPTGEPLRVTVATSGFFQALGVPLRGRGFIPDDDLAGTSPAVVVSDDFWRRQLDGAPDAIGRVIDLGPIDTTVVGITAPRFHGPRLGDTTDVWLSFGAVPAAAGLPPTVLSLASLTIYGRLQEGASLAAAASQVRAALPGIKPDALSLRPLDAVVYPQAVAARAPDDRRVVMLLAALGGILLMVAWLNVSGLAIGRALQREHDIAVRRALGASWRHLVAARLSYAVRVTVPGLILSVVVARTCLAALGPFRLPTGTPIASLWPAIDVPVIAAAFGLTFLIAATAALIPLGRLRRADLTAVLNARGRPAAAGTRQRAILLAAHVTLTVVLLVGSLLFGETVRRAFSRDLGFDKTSTIAVMVQPRLSAYAGRPDPTVDVFAARAADFRLLLERLRERPDVVAVSHGGLPLTAPAEAPPPRPGTPASRTPFQRRTVGGDYARAAGLRLVAGRDLESGDVDRQPLPVLVSRSFAATRWPADSAVGRRFMVTNTTFANGRIESTDASREVAGVVDDALRTGFRGTTTPVVYEPAAIDGFRVGQTALSFVVRVRGAAAAATRGVATTVEAAFPDPVQLSVRTADDVIGEELRAQELGASLFSGFAFTGLALALIGIFSLVTFSVASRARELGIRMALGASPGQILQSAGRVGFVPLLVGVGLGLGASAALSGLVAAYLVDVNPASPRMYTLAALVAVAAGAIACYLPARRALRISPVDVLRAE